MYNARYVSDSGAEFLFTFENGVIFDIDPLSGLEVSLSTAKGYHNAGDVVLGKTIGGVTRKIQGLFFKGDKQLKRREMQRAFAPFSSGKLYFNEKYYCECDVKKTPEFYKKNEKEMFAVQLTCAYPFWLSAENAVYELGAYEPAFSFPVNYSTPHMFGIKDPSKFIDVYNSGEETARMAIEFTMMTQTTNYGVLNIRTNEFIKIADTLNIGDKMRVSWKNNTLQLERTGADGVVVDAFSMLDDESTLFSVAPGNNVFMMQADSGLNDMVAIVTFPVTKAGVYDGIE